MRKQQFQDVDKICNYLKSVETDQTEISKLLLWKPILVSPWNYQKQKNELVLSIHFGTNAFQEECTEQKDKIK